MRDGFMSVPADAWDRIFKKQDLCQCGHERKVHNHSHHAEEQAYQDGCHYCHCKEFKERKPE